MIRSKKYPRIFYRNERARYWADNVRDVHGETCTEYLAKRACIENINYLILHPEDDDPDYVPMDYSGKVIRYNLDETPDPNSMGGFRPE